MKRALVILAKAPVPGRVKTRLIGHLTPEQAVDLHAAMLEDLVDNLEGGGFEIRIAWALEGAAAAPESPRPWLRSAVQEGDDLGERIFLALSDVAAGADYVAAVGSDHPALGRAEVERAFDLLERSHCDVVLGPASDGGYYLLAIAAAALTQRLFRAVDWSTDRVLAQTLERCRELDLEVGLLDPASDIDTIEDLQQMARDLHSETLQAPRVRELLGRWRSHPETPSQS